jgi:hypothetical protein
MLDIILCYVLALKYLDGQTLSLCVDMFALADFGAFNPVRAVPTAINEVVSIPHK